MMGRRSNKPAVVGEVTILYENTRRGELNRSTFPAAEATSANLLAEVQRLILECGGMEVGDTITIRDGMDRGDG